MLRASHIPNIICVLRILLVVPIIIVLLDGNFMLALILIFIAGFSDGLDGFLAKNYDWRTRLGGLLDPLADKFLLVTVMLILTSFDLVPLWLTGVVIGRDVVIVCGAMAFSLLIGPVKPAPTLISKINTMLQLLYIVMVIARQVFDWLPMLAIILTGAGVFCTSAVSGMDYVMRWSRKAVSAAQG
ncbi:MAG: CDP-alcohol phosphatidyltransferase family protein [Gammaproteobacteria bacterium]|nr:CDP-alcohol phosphatidyltransferase family protein [Gammaproteobacteria bacterium]MDP7296639.1 CDP-alcohol phosphatidyltransferase family protein [Gammaproteobacteria bacterium]MDP7418475.1 CDP-alcohol phosphatidyltransferase family protein [Gammaproteobacteria bacterium]MDP7659918.1 CDP-alcohol phosphatidyltransferase family protein [Gammaproteobacteria bacterium]HJP38854.1 CDP-alcohol phosphatidyltransferase family protein [Gammaproteobacteria bacterium]